MSSTLNVCVVAAAAAAYREDLNVINVHLDLLDSFDCDADTQHPPR